MRHAVAIAVLCACGGIDGNGPPDDGQVTGDGQRPIDGAPIAGEPAALAGITAAHNQVRAMVSPGDPLPALAWDAELAATAAAWIAMCRDQEAPMGLLDHNAGRSSGHPYYVGENIYGSGGAPGGNLAQQVVDLWAAEQANYNYAANTCNGVCGHYTQIVWRGTAKVGCAIGDCPGLTFRTSVVCDYGPGGNVNGQRPY